MRALRAARRRARSAAAGRRVGKDDLAGKIVLAPPGALADRWSRRLPDPVSAMASGWMRVKQRAKARGVELPLVISDHADWDELTMTLAELGAARSGSTTAARRRSCISLPASASRPRAGARRFRGRRMNTTVVLYIGFAPPMLSDERRRVVAVSAPARMPVLKLTKGGSGHVTVIRGDRKTQMPMHGGKKELGTGLVNKIKRDLVSNKERGREISRHSDP